MYAESMMILCFRYIADREDAKEVMLDAFYNVFKNVDSFAYQGAGSFKAWIKKIVVNQCLMHLRKKKMAFVNVEDGMTDETGFDDGIIEKLSAKEIIGLIQTLPDGYRAIFNLYVFEGKNHKEIADMLNITEGTSKSQLYKAKILLQKKLTSRN